MSEEQTAGTSEETKSEEVKKEIEDTQEPEAVDSVSEAKASDPQEIKLDGYYAFKKGMSSVYNDKGELIPVTVLSYEPWVVSQVKTKEKDGYESLQVACGPKKAKRASKAEVAHLKPAGFENGAMFVREIRQGLPEGVKVGDRVSIDSLAKGDRIKITSRSKGRGFSGVIKRWGFGGGPAAHGSKFHRQPGSIGNRTWPGRVMAGRKMPGHFGDEIISVKNVQVVEVLPEQNVVLVKGPVPGATNSLVRMVKV